MRVLVCGEEVLNQLDQWPFQLTRLIHGGARGADSLAGAWAIRHGVKLHVFKARWDEHGKAAGPIRNRLMLERGRPHLVVAFPGGPGTANMVRQARAAGVEVQEVRR